MKPLQGVFTLTVCLHRSESGDELADLVRFPHVSHKQTIKRTKQFVTKKSLESCHLFTGHTSQNLLLILVNAVIIWTVNQAQKIGQNGTFGGVSRQRCSEQCVTVDAMQSRCGQRCSRWKLLMLTAFGSDQV